MQVHHGSLTVQTNGPGTYNVTDLVECELDASGISSGVVTVFCRHTSCSLVITENASPDARRDLNDFFRRLVPADPQFRHNEEGPDDMPSHIKAAITKTSESIPVKDGRLCLGTWQGLYLWEHRTSAHARNLAVVIVGLLKP
jgi:secondary thiamine-phosphate synthase enzyme